MTLAASERRAIYQRLETRNRIVGILRIGVPLLGLLTLLALLVQIYVSSLGGRFGIGRIEVTRESVKVQTPEYSGLLEDGSAYRVWAASAASAIDATNFIDLSAAALSIERPTGIDMYANADEARIDTGGQQVIIEGEALVEDSSGTTGRFSQSVFDWTRQTLTTEGAVAIDYSDGTVLRAQGMFYDAAAQVWTFSQVNVTLPDTPSAPQSEQPNP